MSMSMSMSMSMLHEHEDKNTESELVDKCEGERSLEDVLQAGCDL
jgi:hypothetical protein